jgi:hypothetical protein
MNFTIRLFSTIKSLLLPAILAGSIALACADERTDLGVSAAKSWLGLVDAKQYKESWVEAAPFFKDRITEIDWVKMISLARGPFGELKSRELKTAKYATSLPGAPDGEYVVIQFKTSFTNKADAVETITPMKDDKGVWRVSGYFIK